MASTVLFDAQLVGALREGGRKGGWEGQRQLQRAFLKPDQVIYPAVHTITNRGHDSIAR